MIVFLLLYGTTLIFASEELSQRRVIFCSFLAIPLIWLSVTDTLHQTIPDSASVFVAALGLGYQWFYGGIAIADVAASLTILGLLWSASEIYWRRHAQEALGLGDVKLLAVGMLCTGVIAFWTAVLIAAVGGICAILLRRILVHQVETGVPFGPFIAYGLFVTVTILRAPW